MTKQELTTTEQNQKDIAAWNSKLKVLEANFNNKPNTKTATALSNHRMDKVLPLTKTKPTLKSMYVGNAIDLLLPTVNMRQI